MLPEPQPSSTSKDRKKRSHEGEEEKKKKTKKGGSSSSSKKSETADTEVFTTQKMRLLAEAKARLNVTVR